MLEELKLIESLEKADEEARLKEEKGKEPLTLEETRGTDWKAGKEVKENGFRIRSSMFTVCGFHCIGIFPCVYAWFVYYAIGSHRALILEELQHLCPYIRVSLLRLSDT
ncbi:hypothetical protein VNO78_15075 [Psophocarpus tetragonolobus]|uniref:Uncharacterized protein n=1 Tax=Psophocarpus tetragonolobus TaxID=3891 RepID=A0AAN9XJF3_PSOTE